MQYTQTILDLKSDTQRKMDLTKRPSPSLFATSEDRATCLCTKALPVRTPPSDLSYLHEADLSIGSSSDISHQYVQVSTVYWFPSNAPPWQFADILKLLPSSYSMGNSAIQSLVYFRNCCPSSFVRGHAPDVAIILHIECHAQARQTGGKIIYCCNSKGQAWLPPSFQSHCCCYCITADLGFD